LMMAWSRYAMIEKMDVIGGDEIEFSKEGGVVTISANYTVRVPLFKNISLMIEYSPSSAGK